MPIPSTETLREYLSAASVDDWLDAQLVKSLDGVLDAAKTQQYVDTSRAEARDAANDFLQTEVDPHAVIAVILAFARPGEAEDATAGGIFTSAPTPLALLELAVNECQPLDEVIISHRFANGEEVTLTQTWPFGLSGAIDILTPGFRYRNEEESINVPSNS